MIFSSILAFVVLLLATKNYIVSLYAIISILGIVVGVLAIAYLKNWSLGTIHLYKLFFHIININKIGIMESISSILIIGFSIDYIVHLVLFYYYLNK